MWRRSRTARPTSSFSRRRSPTIRSSFTVRRRRRRRSSRRAFLRFDLPSHIADSTTIVRASLLLTQAPNRRVDVHDSVFVYPLAILAAPTVTDIASQLQFVATPGFLGLD